tara:strand:+ start:13804 stop:14052 length:249 start_codon:yes stop_codon:yes gene_type:complete
MALFNLSLPQIRGTKASNGSSNLHVSAKPPAQRSLPAKPPAQRSLPTIPENEDTIASDTNKTITMPPPAREREISCCSFFKF